ncbi:NAD-dependent epimerase/dehydratase family protein [Legionella israelensis]|uniref:NAD-dependent epimerase/dehydratase family protein n=1 Tax=Legionella israelensis TaxID=454 RepID=A0AAX1EFA7_9GAMM|nr:NAD-dependent epimerase/dehydratase family protein [Legionella israelensis]QBR83791.1 NAD-dependent epimerase/dehydratase family protein [Legionella israelensis]
MLKIIQKGRLAMEKVLVTGGGGFIGNHLVSRLLSLGKEVVVLDRCIHKPAFCDVAGAKLIEADVMSSKLLRKILEDIDTCFHLAALASVASCAQDWRYAHENNVLAFNALLDNLVELSHCVKLVYASTSAVYGDNQDLPLSESASPRPTSMYGVTKLCNEVYARVMNINFNLPSIGLRLFNVYGPGQRISNSESGVITLFKEALSEQRPLMVYGDGSQTRDFIYIDDVVDALIAAAITPREHTGIYNICSQKSISILELAETLMTLSKTKQPIVYEQARSGDIYHSLGNAELAKKKLHFQASTALEEGLKKLLLC